MLIEDNRVGDIVDIKANGAVQKGSVNLNLPLKKKRGLAGENIW